MSAALASCKHEKTQDGSILKAICISGFGISRVTTDPVAPYHNDLTKKPGEQMTAGDRNRRSQAEPALAAASCLLFTCSTAHLLCCLTGGEATRLAGLEPTTCGLEDRCSIQLSYRRKCMSWIQADPRL